ADGNHLVFAYAKAITPRYDGPQGTCSEPGPAAITVVSARRSQPGVGGSASPAASACSMNAVAATKDGYAGIEQCGNANIVRGPVRLVRYDAALRPLGHESLGQCGDGASIGGTVRSSDLVISTYQYCSGTGEPTTRVFLSTGAGIRRLLSLPGGTTAIDHITF
ncbi:MAG: hypothetical protein QOF28_2798, partial [Actinomycetota bacterium]|nr:hypothetical protein [Actinomycetota bacterium]